MRVKSQTSRKRRDARRIEAKLELSEVDILIRVKKRILEMLLAVSKVKNMDHRALAYELMEVRIIEEHCKLDKVKMFLDAKVD